MIREIVAYALVVGVVLAIAAHCVDAFIRAIRRPARWVWLAALAGTALLLFIVPARQSPSGSYLGPFHVLDATSASRLASTPGTLDMARKVILATAQPLTDALTLARRVPAAADAWILATWALAAMVSLFLLLSTYRRWRGATRRWPSAHLHGVRVRVAPDMGPAAVGVIAPEVVVPRWLLDAPHEQQRLAIAHELEHVRARDPLLLIAGVIPAVLLPWHPVVWWMLSRLRLAVEVDCDARVLNRQTSDARDYGTTLIDLAQRCGRTRFGAAALAEGSTHLERRLRAMTTRHSRAARVRTGIVAAMALVGLVGACEARLPTQADVDSLGARSAEKIADASVLAERSPTYEVDGNVVSRDSALRIAPGHIATVNIQKRADGSTISIRTASGGRGAALLEKHAENMSAGPRKFGGLIIIDGVKSDPSALAALSPKDIVSIDVLKNEAAMKAYSDPAAANGVIIVTTVKGTDRAAH